MVWAVKDDCIADLAVSYEDALDYCEERGFFIREYQFLHEYNDYTVAELRQRAEEFKNDPLAQAFQEEIILKLKEANDSTS